MTAFGSRMKEGGSTRNCYATFTLRQTAGLNAGDATVWTHEVPSS